MRGANAGQTGAERVRWAQPAERVEREWEENQVLGLLRSLVEPCKGAQFGSCGAEHCMCGAVGAACEGLGFGGGFSNLTFEHELDLNIR